MLRPALLIVSPGQRHIPAPMPRLSASAAPSGPVSETVSCGVPPALKTTHEGRLTQMSRSASRSIARQLERLRVAPKRARRSGIWNNA